MRRNYYLNYYIKKILKRVRFDNDFNSKSLKEFYKNRLLKERVSKFNSIIKNSDKSIYIYKNILKRKINYFNLIYKK